MAPEVVSELQQGYDFSYDWWSLGVCLYQMLLNSLPFNTYNFQLLKSSILNDEPNIPEGSISEEAESLVRQLMTKNPRDRMRFVESIKEHPFFEDFDWELFEERRLDAPKIPTAGVLSNKKPTGKLVDHCEGAVSK